MLVTDPNTCFPPTVTQILDCYEVLRLILFSVVFCIKFSFEISLQTLWCDAKRETRVD